MFDFDHDLEACYDKTLSSWDRIPAPRVKPYPFSPTGLDRGCTSDSQKPMSKISNKIRYSFTNICNAYELHKAIQGLDEIGLCIAYFRIFLEYNQRVTPGGLARFFEKYEGDTDLCIKEMLKALGQIDDCKAYLLQSLENQRVISFQEEDSKIIVIEHSEKFSSYDPHNAFLVLETIDRCIGYSRSYLGYYSRRVGHSVTNFNLFETYTTEDLSHSLQALDKIAGCNAYLKRSLKKHVHIPDVSDCASTLKPSHLSVTRFNKNFINNKCFHWMEAHRLFDQGTSIFAIPKELGRGLHLDRFTYNANCIDHTKNPNQVHFMANGIQSFDKQSAQPKDLRIVVFDDNLGGVHLKWENQLQKILVDDDMVLNKTTLALLGQATCAVMSQIITSTPKTSYFVNTKCFNSMEAHRMLDQRSVPVCKKSFRFQEELGHGLSLDSFKYHNTNNSDNTADHEGTHFKGESVRAFATQNAQSKDFHINIFDDNPLGIHRKWANQFQMIQGDDSMALNKTTLALLGQATGAVMSQILTSPSSSSWTVYSIVAAILAGISFTLASIRIRRKKQYLAAIMSKTGATATATGIVISLGSLIHPGMAWIYGTIACSMLAIALAFA